MGEIVNLRMARKRKDRAGKEQLAQENRARFGRTKSVRDADDLERARDDRILAGHMRDKKQPDGDA